MMIHSTQTVEMCSIKCVISWKVYILHFKTHEIETQDKLTHPSVYYIHQHLPENKSTTNLQSKR